MNLKSQTYMRSTEFKMRQLWLEFVDATGIALRAIAEKVQNFRDWFKKWSSKPMKNKFDNRTLELNFNLEEKPANKPTEQTRDVYTLKGYLDWMEETERKFLTKLGFNKEQITKAMPAHLKREKAQWKSWHSKKIED